MTAEGAATGTPAHRPVELASASGGRFVERVLTVVESCRQQERDVLTFLTEAVQASRGRTRPPTLVPPLTSAA
jgi:hypothetical protein